MNLVRSLVRYVRGSLARQLVLAVVFLHTALIVLLVWELVAREGEALEAQRVARAEGLAAMLATSGAAWVMAEDSAALDQLVGAASKMSSLRYAMFVDPSGRVLAHTEPRLAGKYLTDSRSSSVPNRNPGVHHVARTSQAIDVAAPVVAAGKLIGWARASMGLEDLRARQWELALRGLGFGALAMVIGLIVALLTARSVTRRLGIVASVSERFAAGDRNVRIAEDGFDEVAVAAKGLNAMLDTVAASEASLQQTQRIAHIGSWRHDPRQPALAWSEGVFEMFGFPPGSPPTLDQFLATLEEEDRAKIFHLISEHDPGEVCTFNLSFTRPDGAGGICWVEARVEEILPDGSKVVVGVCQDITEREAAAAQLRQAQKMEAVGQLTGGLAHDFNNLLAIVIGNLDLLQEQMPGGSSGEFVEEALGAALRGSDLTRQLLAFSRRQTLAPKPIDLNELVSGMATLWRRALTDNIEVRVHLARDLWITEADPSQVESAILNLVINARDAMPEGGALTVETGNLTVGAHDQGPDIAPGDYCVVAVTDTGHGMTREVSSRVFEPFFTTKPAGSGSGLGLSMIYGFARQSGGQVRIYSEPGHGTAVTLYLPRAAAAAAAGSPARPSPAARASGETILLVEDDDGLRKVAARQLASLGYRVLQAASGPEALALLSREPLVDLLLTDVVMPGGMNGVQLSKIAVAANPSIRVLHMSGFTQKGAEAHGALDGIETLLSKPYRKADLANKVRELLDAPAAALVEAKG